MPIPVLAARRMSARTIQELERPDWPVVILKTRNFPNGAVIWPANRWSIPTRWSAKIKAAVAARRDPDFMIIARTDARAVEDFDRRGGTRAALCRGRRGRDFSGSVANAEEFRDFASEVNVPLLANMTEFGKSPLLSFENSASSVIAW